MGKRLGRRSAVAWVSAGTLWLAPAIAAATPSLAPVRAHGLELADGRVVAAPSTPVWGSAIAIVGPNAQAIDRLRDEAGPVWIAWDAARGCASGIIVSRVLAPGTTHSASAAETFARAFIARHLDVIAPGSTASDFVVVANDLSSGIRTIGFEQRHDGVPVLGGRLSLRFANDRLAFVAAAVLPAVTVPARATVVNHSIARARARAFIADENEGATLSVGSIDGTFVLPVWTGSHWRYQEVVRLDIESRAPLGRWTVYLDAGTGEPIAREQRMHDAGTVRFDVPVRYPVSRYDALATDLDVVEGGNAAITDLAGQFALTTSPTTVDLQASGPLVDVIHNAGSDVAASFGIANGETVTWSMPDDEFGDAQLSAFVHLSLAKAYVRAIAPGLAWLDETIHAHVNLDGSCNASSDGDHLYFLRAGECQNTARLADVVYHEFGHSVHGAAIIPGVGAQSSSLSEGISDYLTATMTDDSGMGRGFVFNDAPLRELDPPDYEWSWPQDQGESHDEGRIIGGTLWDLRTALRTKLGDDEGRTQADLIWYESIRRAVDIPSMYPEALVADDDDGNLANGTPNVCEINAAFAAHGLLDPGELADLTLDLVPVADGRQAVVTQALPVFADCPVTASDAELRWRLRDAPAAITTVMMDVEDGAWVATIPTQAAGVVVEYQVAVTYSSGTTAALPRNQADPWYQTFFGGAQPIYCLDESADPAEWVFAGAGNTWSFGPLAIDGVDPGDPYDDDGVLLSQDGIYPPWSNNTATGPTIDLAGYDDVRLHYRRWLTVEDGAFDHARISANGEPLWSNLVTEQANVHHVDREWRFHDLPLAAALASGSVQLQFALDSDGGLELGGWTIDALCVVQVVESWCGDAMVSGAEECDDGNTEDGDGCDATCILEEEPDPTTGTDTGGDSTGDDTGDGTAADTSAGESDSASADATVTASSADATAEGSTGDAGQDDGSSSDGCGCDASGDSGGLPASVLLVIMLALPRRRLPLVRGRSGRGHHAGHVRRDRGERSLRPWGRWASSSRRGGGVAS
jgi:cysteine-rich repeat protein